LPISNCRLPVVCRLRWLIRREQIGNRQLEIGNVLDSNGDEDR